MIGEFPDLQGTMGKYYALAAGEPEEVAEAIFEHYLPRFAGDRLPETDAGAAVSLADKIDTIAGSFGIGQKPTGSEDPYGLRRQTLGVISIIISRELEIDLEDVIARALVELKEKIDRPEKEVMADILDFFRGRLQNLFTQEGHRYDVVEAVLSPGISDLTDVRRRLEALSGFASLPEFEPLAVAFKRVVNIIPEGFQGEVDETLLREKSEKELFRLYREKEKGIRDLESRRDYTGVLAELASIRPAVDDFFDEVLVMTEDEGLRNNRLALMSALEALFTGMADFSRMAV
jgi:glycyl-tRNA synthetase beta chain